jgi:perosamine synthetase
VSEPSLIPISRPDVQEEDIAAVVNVLRSGMLANGPEVDALEAEFARYSEARHAIAVSSGTTALVLAGEALGLGETDHVVVPGFTFAATANAFLYLGCSVSAVDVDAHTMNVDAAVLRKALETRPAAAVVIVDLYGSTSGTDEAFAVARDLGVPVIEDAAQAHGARDGRGVAVGSRASATTFSLYATKNMAAGEGGVVVTNDDVVDDAIRRLRNHGGVETYRHETIGLNHRLNEMAAALARRQLVRLPANNDARRKHAALLAGWCREAWGEAVAVPTVFHQFTVRFPDAATRDSVAGRLKEQGVDVRVFYPYAVADLPGVEPSDTPVARRLVGQVLSIPVHPMLDGDELARLRVSILATSSLLRGR